MADIGKASAVSSGRSVKNGHHRKFRFEKDQITEDFTKDFVRLSNDGRAKLLAQISPEGQALLFDHLNDLVCEDDVPGLFEKTLGVLISAGKLEISAFFGRMFLETDDTKRAVILKQLKGEHIKQLNKLLIDGYLFYYGGTFLRHLFESPEWVKNVEGVMDVKAEKLSGDYGVKAKDGRLYDWYRLQLTPLGGAPRMKFILKAPRKAPDTSSSSGCGNNYASGFGGPG